MMNTGTQVLSELTRALYPRPAEGGVSVTVRVIHSPADPSSRFAWMRPERRAAVVTVRCLPGYAWWSCPDSRTLRTMVDAAAGEQGLKRDGARIAHTDGPVTEWRFTYALRQS